MHAMCTGGDRHIQPIVDENPRSRVAHGLDRSSDKLQQGAIGHITLANLNQMYASSRGKGHTANQNCLAMLAEAAPISNHADDRTHAKKLFFGGRLVE
jgi:hypothetical protein